VNAIPIPAPAKPREPTAGDEAIAAFDRLAHDLRSPLASVRTVLQMLRITGLDPAKTRELVDLADRQLMRAVALSDAVGDLARLRNGRLALAHEPLAVARVLGDAADRIRGAAPTLALTVVSSDAGSVTGDPLRLSQAIALLLEPATRGGKPIALTTRRAGKDLVIEAGAELDARSNGSIPELLGEALIEAHAGRIARREDGLAITLPLVD
jgi:K+-sensing histidine kinase KdpD